jgi:hypothetical protein
MEAEMSIPLRKAGPWVFTDTPQEVAGTVRFNGTNFQGYDGAVWKNLDASGASPGGVDHDVQMNDGSSGLEAADSANDLYFRFYNNTTNDGAFRVGYFPGGLGSLGASSIGLGEDAVASSLCSIAIGHGVSATANYAVALGRDTTAAGGTSFAAGGDTQANGIYSVAMGRDSVAGGDYSVAMGDGSTSSGNFSFAMGDGSTASDQYAVATGYDTEASGEAAFACGYQTTASEDYSFVGGLYTDTGANTNTFVWGQGNGAADRLTSPADNTFSVGFYKGASDKPDFTVGSGYACVWNAGEFRWYDSGSSNYVGFEAPALTADQIWVLPDDDGTNGQVLTTAGDGTLSWEDAGGVSGGDTISGTGTVTADYDILTLENQANAASMSNTGTLLRFDQYYYDAGSPAAALAGKIGFRTDGSWTSSTSTQDSQFRVTRVLDGFEELVFEADEDDLRILGGTDKGVVLGDGNSNGQYGFCVQGGSVTGNNGISIGNLSTAGLSGIAIGYGSGDSTKTYNISLGHDAKARDDYAIAIGETAVCGIAAQDGIAIGRDTSVTAAEGIAIGFEATCSGAGSTAIGQDTDVSDANTVGLGGWLQVKQGLLEILSMGSTGDGIRMHSGGGYATDYIAFKTADTLSGDTTYKFPNDGSADQVLKTDGSGNLGWVDQSGTSSGSQYAIQLSDGSNGFEAEDTGNDLYCRFYNEVTTNYGAVRMNYAPSGVGTIGAYSAVIGGDDCTATATRSGVFVGDNNDATTERSVVLGGDTNVVSSTGGYSGILAGHDNTISGSGSSDCAIIGGSDNTISHTGSGANSCVILGGGSNTISAGGSNLVAGANNTVGGGYNVAFGNYVNVDGTTAGLGVGQYLDVGHSHSFVFGKGTGTGTRLATDSTNRFVVGWDVTSIADAELVVYNDSASVRGVQITGTLTLQDYQGTGYGTVQLTGTKSGSTHYLYLTSGTSTTPWFSVDKGGGLLMSDNGQTTGIKANSSSSASVTYELPPAAGTAGQQLTWNSGSVLSWGAAASDERVKENIRDIEVGLAEVLALQPRSYTEFAYSFGPDGLELDREKAWEKTGFVAQEMVEALPSMVIEPEDENEEVWQVRQHQDMVAMLVRAIQEQQEQIDDLRAQVEALS